MQLTFSVVSKLSLLHSALLIKSFFKSHPIPPACVFTSPLFTMPSTSNDAGEDEVMLEQHEGAEGSGGPEAQLVITAIKQLSILAEQQLLNSRDFKLSPDTLNCIRQLTDNLSHLKIMEKPTGEVYPLLSWSILGSFLT